MPTPLDRFLAKQCKEHNLSAVSVSYFPRSAERHRITVYFHWLSGSTCASGNGATVKDATENAALEMAEIRIPAPQLEAVS